MAKPNYTPDERTLYGQLFRDCDPEGTGVVTGEAAVKLFQRTKLQEQVLGEIWGLADQENRGFLTQEDFAKALRLIGQYQAQPGTTLDAALALQPAPLPKFEGINMNPPPPAAYQAPITAQNSGPIRVPPLPPDRVAEYARLFERAGAQNGQLQGDVARTSFEKSGLPADILAHVWNLADTEQRGALSMSEFIIAMHLLASYKAKTLTALPQTVPVGLYEAAMRRPLAATARPGSARAVDSGPIPRQTSGPGMIRGSPARPAFGEWVIGDREKAHYDTLYDKVDSQKLGYISGDQAVGFFGDSGLPSEVLAQVWDLSNIRRADTLDRDEFAVAMYLIKSLRGKQILDLPSELPPNLIPPKLQAYVQALNRSAAAVPPQGAPGPILPQPTKSNADDLFGLDALTSSPVATVPSQTTGGSLARADDPFAPKNESPRGASSFAASPAQQSFFKSFAPTSSFGQSIVAQSTGASAGSGTLPRQASAMDDLLGDTDPEISKKLTKDTSDLANMSNEMSTLTTQYRDVQTKKAAAEADLSSSSQQKRDMEQRLALFRSQFEQARQALASTEEKLALERGEVAKLGQQVAIIDAQAQDVRAKHTDVQAQLQTIQGERDGIKERIRQLNEYVAQTQPEVEKLQAELRHQRGILAITKKQAEKLEEEKAQLEKLKAETAELTQQARNEIQSLDLAKPQLSRDLTGATASSALSSPSVASVSTNPFMRRTPQHSIDHSISPTASVSGNKFDNIFSTAFGPQPIGTPTGGAVPHTSFRQEAAAFGSAVQSQPSQSGPSIRSSDQGDMPTPSTSPPLSSTYQDSPQLPPPPASRQITSKDLPLADAKSRGIDADSVATSVRVETPLSRYDASNTPTNTAFSERPETAKSGGHASVGSKGDIEAAFASAGKPTSRQNTGGFEDVFNVSKATSSDPVAKFNSEFPPIPSGTGIDSAPAPKPKDEFPPIKDLGDDDDSDSDAGRGFEDNFIALSIPPAPTAPIKAESPIQPKSVPKGIGDDIFGPASSGSQGAALFGSGIGKPVAAAPTLSSTFPQPLPVLSASPPPVSLINLSLLPGSETTSVGTAREESPFELRNVSRASNVPSETTFASALSNLSGSSPTGNSSGSGILTDDTLSALPERSSSAGPAVPAKMSIAPAFSSKSPYDAFDSSAFDSLDVAKESSADQNFDDDLLFFGGPGGQHKSLDDEFSATFDAPPAKDAVMHSAAKGKDGFEDAFGIGFDDFGSDFSKSLGGPSSSTAKAAAPPAGGNSHDWEAIMKGFNDQPPAKEAGPTLGKKYSFEDEDDEEDRYGGGLPEAPMPPPAPEPPGKPSLGRAISASTEHDDPILKHLMGMGYARSRALAALEKFDYDISKAGDYLASPH